MTLIPVQVTCHGLPHSDVLEAAIRERVAWLEQFHQGIVGCRVRVEVPHRHHHHGRQVHVRIEATVADGPPVIVSHAPSLHGPAKDLEATEHHKSTEGDVTKDDAYFAVHEAFDAARRRLQDAAREQRGDVKTHTTPA
jgi:hypothetical protein